MAKSKKPTAAPSTFEVKAFELGAAGFAAGIKAPAQDKNVIPLMREAGALGAVGNPLTIKILDAWLRGFHQANLRAPL